MHRFQRALLFTVAIGFFGVGTLLAQRGGAAAGRAPLPSSTAMGAGAFSAFPSSTSRSAAPAIGRPYGFTRPNAAGRPYSRTGPSARNEYRPLPRSYIVAPYYYPFFDWSGGTDYSAAPPDDSGAGYGPDPSTDAMMMNQAALGQQVQRLTAQINDLMYGQPNQQSAASPQQQVPPPVPLTLVLRNGEQIQVQNYAVTDNTFWDFTQRGTRKIPLSSIDLSASVKATQAKGGEFPQIDGTQ